MMRLTVSRKVVLLPLLPLVFLTMFAVLIADLRRFTDRRAAAVAHSKDVTGQTQQLLREISEATEAMSSYAVTRDVQFARVSERFQRGLTTSFQSLLNLVGKDGGEVAAVRALQGESRELLNDLARLSDATTALSDHPGRADLAPLLTETNRVLQKIQSDGAMLLERERQSDAQRDAALARDWNRTDVLLVLGASLAALLTLLLSFLLGRSISRRLQALSENARQFAQGKALPPPLGGSDEIGMLDRTFHEMAEALTRASARERALAENAADVLCCFNLDGRLLDVSSAAGRVFGHDRERLLGESWIDLMVPAAEQEEVRKALARLPTLLSRPSSTLETRCKRGDGRLISVVWSLTWSAAEQLVYGVARDLTERLVAESERQFYLETIDRLDEAVFELDPAGVVLQMSRAWQSLSGAPVGAVLGSALSGQTHAEDREELSQALQGVLLGNRQRVRFRLLREDGGETWVDSQLLPHKDAHGRVSGVRGVLRDVTQAYLQERRFARLALHDPLTRLPNRTLLDDRIQMALASARRGGTRLAIGFIDLDKFKQVNDRLGHDAGDDVLRRLSRGLSAELRKGDTLARWGGDEFVVLLTEIASREEVYQIAERLLAAATEASSETEITISIGFAFFPENGETAEALLKQADRAMFHAKHAGRNNFRLSDMLSVVPPVEGKERVG
jgi:diguanylate cyclase (GGDEF)-like protein/PAS domain S-box-containing protein